jgi:hemerythrin-like domain-containing protein
MATRTKRKNQGGRAQARGRGTSATGRGSARGRAAAGRTAGGRSSSSGGGSSTRGRGRGTGGAAATRGAAASRGRGRARGGAGARAGAATRQQDAIALLKAEHDQVNELFEQFERAAQGRGANGSQRKTEIASEICRQLQIHAAIEEEIFYPAAAGAIRDEDLIPEATVEHQSAKELIAKIERMSPDDELYDATVMVLGEYVRHHVKEEQNELFPQVKRSGLDLKAMGEQLRERRAQMETTG